MTQKELDLLQFSSRRVAESGTSPAKVVRSQLIHSDPFAESFTMCQTAFSVMPSPSILPIFVTRRKIFPRSIPEAFNQTRSSSITQSGTGTVRTCPPLPFKSTMAQCPSRCSRCSSLRATASCRRRPQASSSARSARSRLPFRSLSLGACQSARLCWSLKPVAEWAIGKYPPFFVSGVTSAWGSLARNLDDGRFRAFVAADWKCEFVPASPWTMHHLVLGFLRILQGDFRRMRITTSSGRGASGMNCVARANLVAVITEEPGGKVVQIAAPGEPLVRCAGR